MIVSYMRGWRVVRLNFFAVIVVLSVVVVRWMDGGMDGMVRWVVAFAVTLVQCLWRSDGVDNRRTDGF